MEGKSSDYIVVLLSQHIINWPFMSHSKIWAILRQKALDPDSDPDHRQNLIIYSLCNSEHFLKISSKSVNNIFELFCQEIKQQLYVINYIIPPVGDS